MKKYDLLVIGGGTGGSITAKTAADVGFKACIIDRKRKSDIGSKVCGEAVGKHHFDYIGINPPKGNELARKITGIAVFSPDLKTVYHVKEKGLTGFVINRLEFGQRLLNEALDAGTELLDQTLVLDPILKKDLVVGVKARDLARNKLVEVGGNVVVDASGVAAVLRRKMPVNWGIEKKIANEDVEACYQEIREVSGQMEDPDYLKIYLNQGIAPGGYYWVFPKGSNLVNVGLGIQMVKNFPDPKKQLYKHVLSQPLFEKSKKINGGGGLVSTRRSTNLVGNGILFVGDSACQTNPAHGGGIGPSMMAGKMAAKAACKVMETGDYNQKNLWSYNTDYARGYGTKYAGLDVFRIFIQKCRDEDLNYGMINGHIKGEHIFSRANLYDDVVSKATISSKQQFFFNSLIQTSENMKRIKKIYQLFPQHPEKYFAWVRRVDEIIAEMKRMEWYNEEKNFDFTYLGNENTEMISGSL